MSTVKSHQPGQKPHEHFEREVMTRLRKNGKVGIDDYKQLGIYPQAQGEKYRGKMQTLRRRLRHIASVYPAILSEDGLALKLEVASKSLRDLVKRFIQESPFKPTLEDTAVQLGIVPENPALREIYYSLAREWKCPTNPGSQIF